MKLQDPEYMFPFTICKHSDNIASLKIIITFNEE